MQTFVVYPHLFIVLFICCLWSLLVLILVLVGNLLGTLLGWVLLVLRRWREVLHQLFEFIQPDCA